MHLLHFPDRHKNISRDYNFFMQLFLITQHVEMSILPVSLPLLGFLLLVQGNIRLKAQGDGEDCVHESLNNRTIKINIKMDVETNILQGMPASKACREA